ncbi:uncharacterized membrane protein YqaE (UPF0057 family) [Arthrobacter ginsengisoli]|uniref:Uncharacterized membrane protein YqaE (UPF0057 family) n=1 Tax=Arthrobacter ginsengisoli TaxID=1356565 RepID=A0ABU1UBQ0_9MICC|nr:hypothetical protein [Arthrobacter ginsengisoli]MDR7082627.1 uncharacterized membrane protein YqaE (UPF0057 family) [Arthrobacter ginsengisoli]
MGDFFRNQLFNIIAVVFLALFVIVWGSVLFQVWVFIPKIPGTAPDLNGAVVCAAGALSTSLSSLTASAMGFTIAEVRREEQAAGGEAAVQARAGIVDTSGITSKLSGRIIAALMVYLVIGLLVLGVWLVKGTASTDLIGAFSLSLLGWIIGAAGVVFQTEKPNTQPSTAG